MGGRRLALIGLAAGLLASACADPPKARFQQAREAASSEDLDTFLDRFTPASAELLDRIDRLQRETSGKLSYLDPVYDVLPEGEVVETEVTKGLATLTVERREGSVDVHLRPCDGTWCIDAMLLETFWAPLEAKEAP